MQLKPGLRLQSVACDCQLIVVKGSGDVDVRCGGSSMVPVGASGERAVLDAHFAGGTRLGKRYATDAIELLCTKPGDGSLSVGDLPLEEKNAKALPASD